MSARDVQMFCKHWLIDHIIHYDYEFSDFLANQRIMEEVVQKKIVCAQKSKDEPYLCVVLH